MKVTSILERNPMNFQSRFIRKDRIIRIYEEGEILLFGPEVLQVRKSTGAVRGVLPLTDSIDTCLLCNRPSRHWGVFMTTEEALANKEESGIPTSGSFFALCKDHAPSENNEAVCDAVYEIMKKRSDVLFELRKAQTVVETWLEELKKGGRSEKDSIEIILSMLDAGELTENHQFSDDVKTAIRILLFDELNKEP